MYLYSLYGIFSDMLLYNFRFPDNKICNCEELYFHRQKDLQIFDSYFNCFPVSQYQEYTNLNKLSLHFITNESATAFFYLKTEKKITLLDQKVVQADTESVFEYEINKINEPSILYVKFSSQGLDSKPCIIKEARWEGDISSNISLQNNIKIACVICTYKREEFVLKNLKTITQFVNNTNLSFDVFVIDNGNTLSNDETFSKVNFIHLIQNKNLGGSGGFTRGIMEVLKANQAGNCFTHILLMDDDIVFDPEILRKTNTFLQNIKTAYKNSFIAGSMLNLDNPNIQHEAGALYNFLFIRSLRSKLDLSKTDSIFKNISPGKIDYAGWWYCLMPIENLNTNELPLPFFIKADDIEYSIRKSKGIITLNGIGVWHKTFVSKQTPYLVFYSVRNRLITNSIHKDFCYITNIILVLARYIKAIQKNIEAIPFITKAFEDFLKGPDYFLQIDGEILNNELRQMQAEYEKKQKSSVFVFFTAIGNCIKLSFLYLLNPRISKKYKSRLFDFISWDSWCKRLGIIG